MRTERERCSIFEDLVSIAAAEAIQPETFQHPCLKAFRERYPDTDLRCHKQFRPPKVDGSVVVLADSFVNIERVHLAVSY